MLKTISLLAILVITISFSIQYADAIPQMPPPEAPSGFKILFVGNEQVLLEWDQQGTVDNKAERIDKYVVTYREPDINADNYGQIVENDTLTLANYRTIDAPHYKEYLRVSGLDNSLDYKFTIRAHNDYGMVELIPGLLEKYGATATLQRNVQNLKVDFEADPNNNGNVVATLNWDEPINTNVIAKVDDSNNNTSGYIIRYAEGSKSLGAFNRTSDTSIELSDLKPDTLYRFQVTANQQGNIIHPDPLPTFTPNLTIPILVGDHNQSVVITETTPEQAKKLFNSTLVNLTKESTRDTITLSWTGEQATCSLEVTQNGKHVKFVHESAVKTPLTIENLKPNTEYTFDFSCPNNKTTTTTATTQSAGVPDVPDNLKATLHENVVNVFWQKPNDNGSPITDYIIEYSSDNGNTWSTYNDGVSSSTSVLVTGLGAGEYVFRVSAENSIGQGDTQVSFYYAKTSVKPVDDNKLNPVTNLQAKVDDKQVTLTWNAPAPKDNSPEVSGYDIWYRNGELCDDNNRSDNTSGYDDSTWCKVGFNYKRAESTETALKNVTTTTDTSHTILNLTNGVVHDFRVEAVSGTGVAKIMGTPSFVTATPQNPNPSTPTPPKSPVPEIPGAVPPGSDDDIETTVGGDKTVTLKLFAFEDTSSQAFVDEKCVRDIEGVECPTEKNIADGIHDGDRINVVGGSERGDSSIPPIHEYGDGKRQMFGGDATEGNSPVSITVIIYQPSTGEMELMDRLKSTTPQEIELLPEPFYIIPMKPDGYEFTTPTFTDENDIEHKGVLKVNETYQTGITIDELFVNNSSPEFKLEPGAVITVGIGVIPSN